MSKYLKISSKGEIPVEAFTLMGASTKRQEDKKIGMFGSGNKYAISHFLKNNIKLHVYAGVNEIKITTQKKELKEQEFDIICFNDITTSITTDMGPKWKLWQAIRELYSNALDEGLIDLKLCNDIEPKENETHFYLETNVDILKFWHNILEYFCLYPKPLSKYNVGSETKIEVLDSYSNKLSVFKQTIKCNDDEFESLFDYEYPNIELSEERLISSSYDLMTQIGRALISTDNIIIPETIFTSLNEKTVEMMSLSGNYGYLSSTMQLSDVWKTALKGKKIIPDYAIDFFDVKELRNLLVLPNYLYNRMELSFGDEIIYEQMNRRRGEVIFKDYNSSFASNMLKEVGEFFTECKFNVPYPVEIVECSNQYIYGFADTKEGKILIDKKSFDKGKSFVANVIIEEYIHLKYGVKDETRQFQESVIDEFLTYMKKHNAYTL